MVEQLHRHASVLQYYSQELKEVNDAPEQAQEARYTQIIRTPSHSAIWKWRIWVKIDYIMTEGALKTKTKNRNNMDKSICKTKTC